MHKDCIMMKFLLSCLFLFIVLCTKGQVVLGPKIGVNMATLIDGDDSLDDLRKPKPGVVFGLLANYKYSDAFSVQAEVLLSNKGLKLKVEEDKDGNPSNGVFEIEMTCAEVPVLGVFQYNIGENFHIFGEMGVYWAYWLNGKNKAWEGGVENISDVDFDQNDINRSELGYCLGTGIGMNTSD